jgi:hypothetical protein
LRWRRYVRCRSNQAGFSESGPAAIISCVRLRYAQRRCPLGAYQITALNKPEPIKAIAPNWGYIAEDGLPRVSSIMQMQDFWSGKYYQLVEKKVSRE